MDADGTDRTRLTDSAGNDLDPAWSPDGARIAFIEQPLAGQLRTSGSMDADGTDPVRLTTDAADDLDPAWSPDGSTIAFETARDGGAARSGR